MPHEASLFSVHWSNLELFNLLNEVLHDLVVLPLCRRGLQDCQGLQPERGQLGGLPELFLLSLLLVGLLLFTQELEDLVVGQRAFAGVQDFHARRVGWPERIRTRPTSQEMMS